MMEATILFLCPHGAAKSVLAAALFQRLADEHGLPLPAACAGTEPDPAVAPGVAALLARKGLVPPVERPQLVTAELIAGARRVISLGCSPDELPLQPRSWEVWDDVPPPSRDLEGAYEAIRRHVVGLLDKMTSTS